MILPPLFLDFQASGYKIHREVSYIIDDQQLSGLLYTEDTTHYALSNDIKSLPYSLLWLTSKTVETVWFFWKLKLTIDFIFVSCPLEIWTGYKMDFYWGKLLWKVSCPVEGSYPQQDTPLVRIQTWVRTSDKYAVEVCLSSTQHWSFILMTRDY